MMSFITTLKKDSNVRKIFGKREITIIEKQLFGVGLTQSEKNRLSRDIRKKFEAIRLLIPYSHLFNLKKGAEITKITQESIGIIKESAWLPKIKKISLFGSAAENKLTFSSDIDLSVEFTEISLPDSTRFRKEIMGRVPDRMDVQVYNFLPTKIQNEINTKGRALYERKDS